MKKIFVMMTLIAAIMLAACSEKEVEITLPADLFEGQSEEDIKSALEEQGVKNITFKEDGSIYYKMTEKEHSEMMDGMKSDIEESLKELSSGTDFPSIKKAEYNKDFTEFKLYVDREAFETSMDAFATFTLGLIGTYYNVYDGKNEDDIKVTVKIIDEATNEEFDKAVFPDDVE